MTLTTSAQWLGLSDWRMLLLTENCLQYQKQGPYKGRVQFLCLFVLKLREMVQLTSTMPPFCQHKTYLQNDLPQLMQLNLYDDYT